MGSSLKLNRVQKLILGKDISKLLIDQDQKTPLPSSYALGQGDSDTTEYKPFTQPSDAEMELVYLYSSMGRIACEIIPKDTLRRWFTFVKGEKEEEVSRQEDKGEKKEKEEQKIGSDVFDKEAQDFDEALQKKLRLLRTPQNMNWGYKELMLQAMIWENLYGWACIAYVKTAQDQNDKEITDIEGERTQNLDWIVFTKIHVLEEIFDREGMEHNEIPASLLPDAFSIELEGAQGWAFTETVPMENCIMYNFRPKLKGWEGYPIMYPIFGPLIYLENILYGNTQAVWSQGMGNFAIEWPTSTDLANVAIEFGSLGNKKITHFHKSDKNLSERIYNASLSGTIYNPSDLMKQNIDFVCGYLQVPAAVLFGTPQGALSSSWIQDINYETTLMVNQENISPLVETFLEWALGYLGIFHWNTGEIIDEGMRADARIKQLQYMTLNEVRERDDLPPLPDGDVLLSEYNSKNIGINFNTKMPDNKARKAETGEEAGTPEKERPEDEKEVK